MKINLGAEGKRKNVSDTINGDVIVADEKYLVVNNGVTGDDFIVYSLDSEVLRFYNDADEFLEDTSVIEIIPSEKIEIKRI